MLPVLLGLCAYYSVVTWAEQHPTGAAAGEQVAAEVVSQFGRDVHVLIAARDTQEDAAFADTLAERLKQAGVTVVATMKGQPPDARRAIATAVEAGDQIDVIAANQVTATWTVFDNLPAKYPALADTKIVQPRSYWWPNFLKASNLMNIADQISVIAILAVGMTLVIITGGIDLSVGSMIALSAVVAARLIRDFGGADRASAATMFACCLVTIGLCSLVGTFSGVMVARFTMPPFIVTLSMMLIAGGLAEIVADSQSIYELPDRFVWLGRGAGLFGIPNPVVLMVILYAAAHVLMTRMPLGRYIYALGGNIEAARLSGVRVERIQIFVYTVCSALAGLGGIVLASRLKSGSPTYGFMYEVYTIAAAVVGGTSLSGGEGKIFGTLIGAFMIAVIQNGMNLTGVESRLQKVVLGLVILGAVLLDQLKRRGWTKWAA
jgi:ribose transport system permease protein